MGELSLTIIPMLTFPSSLWLTAEPAGHCTGLSTKAPSVSLHPSSCLSGAASSQALEEVKGPGDSLAQSHLIMVAEVVVVLEVEMLMVEVVVMVVVEEEGMVVDEVVVVAVVKEVVMEEEAMVVEVREWWWRWLMS